MSKSDQFETALLLLMFNNTNIANVGDATGLRGSSAPGSLYMALHTADPTDGGDQTNSEVSYTGYARVAIARSGAGFTVAGNLVSVAANTVFGACTAGSATATHWSVGIASSGASMIFYRGALSPSIAISSGVTPRVDAGAMATEN